MTTLLPTVAVVINLARRPDRLALFQERWARFELELGLPVHVHTAVDGEQLDVPSWWRESPGAYGCYLSHQQVLSQYDGPVLVLEDDAVFRADFAQTLTHHPDQDWDLLYLGGRLDAFSPIYSRPGIYQVPGACKTHAYIARDPKVVLDVLDDRLEEGQHVDVILRDPRLTKLAAQPFVVGQDEGRSDIDLIAPRRFSPQFWNHNRILEGQRHGQRLPA